MPETASFLLKVVKDRENVKDREKETVVVEETGKSNFSIIQKSIKQ